MTKTYTQLCAELVPLQAKADRLERDLVVFDAWIISEEGQRFLDLREARDDAFYALSLAEQEQLVTHQDLLDAIDDAHLEWFEAQATLEPDDANSQAALARAQAHYDAAIQALEDFNLKALNMNKTFDIFLGRLDGWHTFRVAQNVSATAVNEWLGKGYRIETEHQIGVRLHEVYLVKV